MIKYIMNNNFLILSTNIFYVTKRKLFISTEEESDILVCIVSKIMLKEINRNEVYVIDTSNKRQVLEIINVILQDIKR